MIKIRKNKDSPHLPFDSKIERIFLKRHRKNKKRVNMAETIDNANGERACKTMLFHQSMALIPASGDRQLWLTTLKLSLQLSR